MNTKKCNKCNKIQSVDNFYKASKNKDGLYHTCKDCKRQIDRNYHTGYEFKYKRRNQHQYRANLKQKIANIKAVGCAICSEKEQCCLDFHHLDPTKKDMTIAKLMYQTSWDAVQREIDKCILVCANCHRKIHANVLACPVDSGAKSTKLG